MFFDTLIFERMNKGVKKMQDEWTNTEHKKDKENKNFFPFKKNDKEIKRIAIPKYCLTILFCIDGIIVK